MFLSLLLDHVLPPPTLLDSEVASHTHTPHMFVVVYLDCSGASWRTNTQRAQLEQHLVLVVEYCCRLSLSTILLPLFFSEQPKKSFG